MGESKPKEESLKIAFPVNFKCMETASHIVQTAARPGPALPQKEAPEREVLKVRWVVEAALILPILVYGQAVFFDFVYDDHTQIGWNPWLRSLHNLPKFFTQSVWAFMNNVDPHSYYRPLQSVWFAICYRFFGDAPGGWHAASLLLHLAVVGAVFWCGMELLQDGATAAVGALLFAIHPVHCEAIDWVAGVAEPLCGFFVVTSLAAYLRARRTGSLAPSWAVLSWVLVLAALLSKEMAFCFPILVFFHRYISELPLACTRWSRLKKAFLAALPYTVICLMVLTVRHFVLRGTHSAGAGEWRQSFVWVPGTLLFYARQLMFPVRLALFYELPLHSVGRIELLASWLVLGAASVGCGYFLISRKWSTELFLAVWMVAAILPAASVTGTLGLEEAVHDRYLYLPSVGFCILASVVLQRVRCSRAPAWRRLASAAAIVLCTVYAASSTLETRAWRDDLAVCEHAAKRSPGNALAVTSYAFYLAAGGRTNEAVEVARRATKANPQFLQAWLNLGSSEFLAGDLSGAQSSFEEAERLLGAGQEGTRPYLELQLGKIEMRRGNVNGARSHFLKSFAEDPTSADCRSAIQAADHLLATKPQTDKGAPSNAARTSHP